MYMQIGGGANQQKPWLIMPSFAYRAPGPQPGLGSSPRPWRRWGDRGGHLGPFPGGGGQNTWSPLWGGRSPTPGSLPWGAADFGGSPTLVSPLGRGVQIWGIPAPSLQRAAWGEVPAHLCPFPWQGGLKTLGPPQHLRPFPHTWVPSQEGPDPRPWARL